MTNLAAILQQLADEKRLLTSELEQFHKDPRPAAVQQHTHGVKTATPPCAPSLQKPPCPERAPDYAHREGSFAAATTVIGLSRASPPRGTRSRQSRRNALEAMESKPLHMQKDALSMRRRKLTALAACTGCWTTTTANSKKRPTFAPTATESRGPRETAQREADALQRIPYSASKVRLTGAEASASLAEISQRLMDNRIPESRRDIAPIFAIRTHLFDTLIVSENRSLKPVGKEPLYRPLAHPTRRYHAHDFLG